MMELAKKTVIVVGLGVTGIAVARFLKKRGAVRGCDRPGCRRATGTPGANNP